MSNAKKRPPTTLEWIGGTVTMPAFVDGDAGPYRPETMMLLESDGPAVAFEMAAPGEKLPFADFFRKATRAPLAGPPRIPTRVRVASPELATALRGAVDPQVEIVCAPTPELDGFAESMRAHLDENAEEETSYLGAGVSAEAMGAFFAVAARAYRAGPWTVVPNGGCVLQFACPARKVDRGVVSVMGQVGASFGFVVFASPEDYDQFLAAAEAEEDDTEPRIPHHMGITFQRGADIPKALRKEVAARGWEVASANAYPDVVLVDPDLVSRSPTADELAFAHALLLAITDLVASTPDLRLAWDDAGPFSRHAEIVANGNVIAVDVTAPHPDTEALSDEDALLARFEESPEARAFPAGLNWVGLVVDHARGDLGVDVTDMQPEELDEILFDIFPAKVVCDATDARAIVAELRAFFAFLVREKGAEAPHARACLQDLNEDAVSDLIDALGDASRYGMSKTIVLAGAEAGFDIHTREGVEAWMKTVAREGFAGLPPLPSAPPQLRAGPSAAQKKAKKNQRKAARKARKKGR